MNPRAAINDLLPFQGSPFGQLGYFSKMLDFQNRILYSIVAINGEDGIRTHAPFRTNGFQDRLVMTTSIPLHTLTYIPPLRGDNSYFNTFIFLCQQLFLGFLNF